MGCSFSMGWNLGCHNSTLGTISNEEGEGELGSRDKDDDFDNVKTTFGTRVETAVCPRHGTYRRH